MKPELSIIIPCYNCAETLRETVDSCYLQDLRSFEIVMVDDGSSDGTRGLMTELSKERDNIRIFFHEKNQGGGAARNTAVSHAKADVIFCIDSDDSLPEGTLCRMYSRLSEKKCDGVLFSGAYVFSKKREDFRKVDFGQDPDKQVALDVLFSGKPWAPGAYFLYTKKAFEIAGGYPTDHGFDTQGFGFRFIARGLSAFPCPDAFMYQRQMSDKESYFERAYRSGEFSINYYLILLGHLEVFSEKIRESILGYDIFRKNTLEDNILQMLQKEYSRDPAGFFASEKQAAESSEQLYQRGEFQKAAELFISGNPSYANAEFDGLRYLSGAIRGRKMTTGDYRRFGEKFRIRPHAYNTLRPTLYQRVSRKIGKIAKRNPQA